MRIKLQSPQRLIPVHICGRPPSYFILGGLVFTQVPAPVFCLSVSGTTAARSGYHRAS